MSESQFRQEQPVIAESDVKNVFKVLHGYYGNLFFTKFSTGAVENGEDQGIANARRIWAHGLRDFDGDTIKMALRNCQARHAEYPPSLPQFVALCAAAKPREVYRIPNAIGMSSALRSQYARQARAINEKHEAKAERRRTGYVPLPVTLDGLKQAIASAVGDAGGNEAAELLRLDRLYERTPA
ncbi:hypothetical protein [Variovorax sp. GB1P17]|uniref:hypothetical protein n=1 Tax=Variovorax sp. GB1P17 TaxID=3443740 RepID=UPI003F46B07B